MAIVLLKKVTIFTLAREEKGFLSKLQSLNILHIITQGAVQSMQNIQKLQKSQEALKFLLTAPHKRKQLHTPKTFNAQTLRDQALSLKASLEKLHETRDVIRSRISTIKPWGDFTFYPLSGAHAQKLWFYRVPHSKIKILQNSDLIWQNCGKDHRFFYIAVISVEKPSLPFARSHIGTKPLSVLQLELENIENEIEELQSQRIALTRWIDLYINSMHRLEDQEQFEMVRSKVYKDDDLLMIQAWVPQEKIEVLKSFASTHQAALLIEKPKKEETPPTLLKNSNRFAAGENLLTFYTVPNYWEHDTSSILFISFILFFGMILGDAGYGLVIGLLLLIFYHKMKQSPTGRRFITLFAYLGLFTILWGLLVGSYFGVTPAEGSMLSKVHLFDINDYDTMMKLSIFIGAGHIILANILKAMDIYRTSKKLAILAPLGWILLIIGGLILFMVPDLTVLSYTFFGLGLFMITAFTSAEENAFKRLFSGFTALAQLTTVFGDILSYLRLFALGLATASMGLAFNQLASQVSESFPGIGVLFAILILIVGHLLNFTLGIVSGVVHGLRLNLIEFLKYDSSKEGYAFKVFEKKEIQKWNS